MAVKQTQMTAAMERSSAYPTDEEVRPSFVSYWLTGLIVLMVLALAFTVVDLTTQFPSDGVGADAPMVLPEASTMPGSSVRDGRTEALDNIAGIRAGTIGSANSTSIDSRIGTAITDRLPGDDTRRAQPVPAPL
jgi:hypothetical protein